MGGAAAARAMAAVSRLTAEDPGSAGTPPPPPAPAYSWDPSRNRAAGTGTTQEQPALDVHACDSEDYEALLLGLDAMLNTGSQDMAASADLLGEQPPEPSSADESTAA